MPTPAQNIAAQARNRMRAQMDNPEQVDSVRRDFYIYAAQCTALAIGASVNTSIQIEADSEFILQKLSFQCVNGATNAAVAAPNLTVQITDTGSGRQLMQTPIPVVSFFGTGQLPFILPNPKLFMRNSTIQIAFTSTEIGGGITQTCRLAFIGYKIYTTA